MDVGDDLMAEYKTKKDEHSVQVAQIRQELRGIEQAANNDKEQRSNLQDTVRQLDNEMSNIDRAGERQREKVREFSDRLKDENKELSAVKAKSKELSHLLNFSTPAMHNTFRAATIFGELRKNF